MKTVSCVKLHVLAEVEHERGRGSKVDGYIGFETKDSVMAYQSAKYADRDRNFVPDYYVNYEYIGEKLIEVSKLRKAKDGSCYFFD